MAWWQAKVSSAPKRDRLRSFQQGPFASRYNALALTHIEDAQNWLNRRTLERMRRGVEGTHKA